MDRSGRSDPFPRGTAGPDCLVTATGRSTESVVERYRPDGADGLATSVLGRADLPDPAGQPSSAAARRSSVAEMFSALRTLRSSTPEMAMLASMAKSGRKSSHRSVTRAPVSVGSIV